MEDRNRLIDQWAQNPPENRMHAYFGLPYERSGPVTTIAAGLREAPHGVIDGRMSSQIDAIQSYTNDVIAFSRLLGDALHRHATAKAKEVVAKFRVPGPRLTQLDFSRFSDIMPAMDEYKIFEQTLQPDMPSVAAKPWYSRLSSWCHFKLRGGDI